jgi:hypothetical protein
MKFRNPVFLLCVFLFTQGLLAQPIWERRFTGVELGTDKLHFADAYFHAIEIEPDVLIIDSDTGLPTCRTNCGQDAMGIIPSAVLAKHCPLLKIIEHRGYIGFLPLVPEDSDYKRFPITRNKVDSTVGKVRLVKRLIHEQPDSSGVPSVPTVTLDHPIIRETMSFCREQQGDRLKM